MSSKRDTIVPDVDKYPRDDLVDLYNKLADSYLRLKQEQDDTKQELHQIRSQNKILQRSQNDLQNELDGISESHKKDIEALETSSHAAIEALKQAKSEIENDKLFLETKIEELDKQMKVQNEEIEELRVKLVKTKPAPRISDSFTINLEVEIEALKEKLLEVQEKLRDGIRESREKDLKIDELQERILCLDDNLESKKIDLEEKNEAMESLQEQLNELTVEIAMLKSEPDESSEFRASRGSSHICHFKSFLRPQRKLTFRGSRRPAAEDEVHPEERARLLQRHEEDFQRQGNGDSSTEEGEPEHQDGDSNVHESLAAWRSG
jgi:DNA repair exonuclease SbcCD ATPase subunit